MTQKSHHHSSSSNDSSHQKSSNSKGQKASSRSKLFRFCYKTFKYSTFLLAVVFVVLSGIMILGDSSQQVQDNRTIFNVYKNSGISTKIVDDVNALLKKQSSKYVSNKAINLYIEEKSQNDEVSDSLDHKLDDLVNFAEFYSSESASESNILKLPLSFYNQEAQTIVPETQSSKWLGSLKTKVRKLFEKNKIEEDESIKQLKWSRVKKLIDNAKFGQIFELMKKTIINGVWKWLNDEPSVILLIVDDYKMTGESSGNKRQLNKWIRDHSQNSVIIILSRYQINDLYDTKEQDHFKSYQVQIGVDQLEQESLCGSSLELTQVQCSILKSRFSTLNELEQFLDSIQNEKSTLLKNEQSDEATQVLESVCQKGHIKYYFYEDQESANEVLSRNKKTKKSRLDRELQALLVKWSQLKRAVGLNRIKDVWNTLKSDSSKVQALSLWQANELGLVFDFNLHQLKWSTQEDRIRYEILKGKTCKGGSQVEEELRNDEEQEEEKQKKMNEREEKQDEEVQEQEDEQVIEQEYQDNFIKYEAQEEQDEDKSETDNVAQENEENDQTEQVQAENHQDETETEDNQAQPDNQPVGQENQSQNTENQDLEEVEQTEQTEQAEQTEQTEQTQTEIKTEGVDDQEQRQHLQQVQEENIEESEEQTVAEQQEIQQQDQENAEQTTEEAEEDPLENANQEVQESDADETVQQDEQQLTDNIESQNNDEIQEEQQSVVQEEQSVEQTQTNEQSVEEDEQEQQQPNQSSEQEQAQDEPTDENTEEQQVGQEQAEQTTEEEQQPITQSSEQAVQEPTEQTTDNSQQTVEQSFKQASQAINEQSTEPDSTNQFIQEQQVGENSQGDSQQAQPNDQSEQNVQAEFVQTQNQPENNQQEPQPQEA